MNKLLGILLFPFLSLSQVMYVSSSGSDISGQGTFSNPFLTVQNAIDNGASEILLLEGIYINSEQITGSNIIIKPNLDDNVVYDGTLTINDPGNVSAFWTQHEGNIYKTEITQPIWQLFINDVEMVMARWPNATFEEDLIYNKESWAHSEPEDIDGLVNDITDISLLYNENKNLSDFNNSDIDGAILIANFGSFKTKVKQVLSTGLDVPNSKFEYTPIGNEYRTKHHYYFLEGKLAFLDHPNEWFYDNEFLYVWSEDGSDLINLNIKGKTQEFAFIFDNCNNVTIEGLKFFATTISIQNSINVSVQENVFSYPNYSKRMLGDTLSPLVTNIDQDLITTSLPSNSSSSSCVFSNNVFEHTDGEALILAGDNHLISNNYFHHIDWSCAETQALGLTIYCNGENLVFENNIIHTTGASSTLSLGANAKILYNDISNTGLAQSDGAIVQITKNVVTGTETAYNWFHDTEKMGFRFDAPSGEAEIAGTEGLAHHNVIWNIGENGFGGIGMMIKGDHHEIYNNTVFNCDKTDILILDEDSLINLDTYTENNAADVISNHRVDDVLSEDDIPGFTNNNFSLYGDHTSNYTSTIEPLLNTSVALIYNSESVVDDRYLYNFSPNDSLLIDQGKIINTIKNPISTHPNVLQRNITESFEGANPDIGAYEYGTDLWIPGINFEPVTYPWDWPTSNVYGCSDLEACNYNPDATDDDGSCEYAPEYYDCDESCINDFDNDFICDELDNCPEDYNPNQEDFNSDNEGDACDGIGLNEKLIDKKLIKVADILGRDVNVDSKQSILLYIYDDGSIEKKYSLK